MSATAKTIDHETGQEVPHNGGTLTPIDLTARALEMGLGADQLEKFMDLQERHEAKEARVAFNEAMARVQSKIQPILADADNKQTGSKYAKLETIVKTLAPIYTGEGFFVSFGTEECKSEKLTSDGWFRTTAELSHAAGHTKEYHVDLPADTKGPQGTVNKTLIHGTKSAITYARVILMGLMFNFTTTLDVDDDGNGASIELINEEEAAKIRDHIEALSVDESAFLKYLGVGSVEEIPYSRLQRAMNALKRKEKQQG